MYYCLLPMLIYFIFYFQVGNHKAVAKFAARGAGTPGVPPVSAPLADPFATPDMDAVAPVDAALRHVAHALLVGHEEK